MTLEELQAKSCASVSATRIGDKKMKEYLKILKNWEIDSDGKLTTYCELTDFDEAVELFNAVAELGMKEGHYPDVILYDQKSIMVLLFTYDAGGITEKDLIFAAKVEHLGDFS